MSLPPADPFWDQVAAYAWRQQQKHGRGAVLIHEGDVGATRSDGTNLAITYLPRGDASPLWNEHTLADVEAYDPTREVFLITMQTDGQALCMILEQQPGAPSPPEAADIHLPQPHGDGSMNPHDVST